MTIRELLNNWFDHDFTDVQIYAYGYDCFTDETRETMIACYDHKEHNHWYYGQLSYFSSIDIECNEIAPYFDRKVKNFFVINTIEIDKYPCIGITIE